MRNLAVLLIAVTLGAGAMGCEHFGGGWPSATPSGAAPGCNCGAHASAGVGGTVVAQSAPLASEPPVMKAE